MRNARNTRRRSVKIGLTASLLVLLAALVVAGCGGGSSSGGGEQIAVVGYSTPQSVYEEGLEPAFEKTSNGSGASFTNSFGASGDQSRAVAAGQPADLVHFSVGSDMTRLVEEGQVASNWEDNKYKGIGQDSVVVLAVKKGNPDGIKSFDDLLTKDVSVVTPARPAGTSWRSTARRSSRANPKHRRSKP